MMRNWIAPALVFLVGLCGFFWLVEQSTIQSDRVNRDFREACAKVNGTAVWNNKYWECLK
jgi:hypothetical protein